MAARDARKDDVLRTKRSNFFVNVLVLANGLPNTVAFIRGGKVAPRIPVETLKEGGWFRNRRFRLKKRGL